MCRFNKLSFTAIIFMAKVTLSFAGAFSVYTAGNGSAVGNFAAGVAAEAADASTGWYNPAGLALIHSQQAVFGGVGFFPNTQLTGTSTVSNSFVPSYVQHFSNLQGGADYLIPSFHYALPLGDQLTLALSLVSPFDLFTDWNRQSPVRYSATTSELTTYDISPELGAKLTEHVAIGAGLDLQYARIKLNTVFGSPATEQYFGQAPTTLDSYTYNKGDSFGVGFHAGVLVLWNENHSRVGLNYQSRVEHQFHGYSRLTGRLASPGLNPASVVSINEANSHAVFWSNDLISNPFELPDILTLSGYQDLTEQWALLGSVVYTDWKSLPSVVIYNIAAFSGTQIKAFDNSPQNFNGAWRFAMGANYKVNEQWMMRIGGGFDETPTQSMDRSIRIPDSNQWALSIGTHYQITPHFSADAGYTHLFSTGYVPIKRNGDLAILNAQVKNSNDLVGMQLTWLVDGAKPIK